MTIRTPLYEGSGPGVTGFPLRRYLDASRCSDALSLHAFHASTCFYMLPHACECLYVLARHLPRHHDGPGRRSRRRPDAHVVRSGRHAAAAVVLPVPGEAQLDGAAGRAGSTGRPVQLAHDTSGDFDHRAGSRRRWRTPLRLRLSLRHAINLKESEPVHFLSAPVVARVRPFCQRNGQVGHALHGRGERTSANCHGASLLAARAEAPVRGTGIPMSLWFGLGFLLHRC